MLLNNNTKWNKWTSFILFYIIFYLQVFVQPLATELVLQMDPEVHVFHRVNYDVDELHAGHLVDTQQGAS